MTAWTDHVKQFAKSKGISYKDALKNPESSATYKALKGGEIKQNIEMKIEELEVKKTRGRPKKYNSEEEAKKAKTMKTMESNKRKKAILKGEGMETSIISPELQVILKKKRVSSLKGEKPKGEGLLEELKKREMGKPNKIEENPSVAAEIREIRTQAREANNANPLISPRPTRKGGRKTLLAGKGASSSRIAPEPETAIETIRREAAAEAARRAAIRAARIAAAARIEAVRRVGAATPPLTPTSSTESLEIPRPRPPIRRRQRTTIRPVERANSSVSEETPLSSTHTDSNSDLSSASGIKKGKGLNVGYTTENANGLAHIYPISHESILQMLSCCPKK